VKLQLNQNLSAYFKANQEAWNKKTEIHITSDLYDVEGFKKGKNSLYDIELKELGVLMKKNVLHLQCHFGLDTLSLSRLGASVTGVDFSEVAIKYAKKLSGETHIKATFLESNVYDITDLLSDTYDIVFCSYGSICWLPDMLEWANMISKVLKPGGFLYMIDFHPMLNSFDCLLTDTRRSYFNTLKPFERHWKGTYTNYSGSNETIEYNWNHSLAEIFKALSSNNLSINSFSEYSFLPVNWFPNLVKGPDNFYRVTGHEDEYPLLFSIKAIKH
jgi:2-polyprenyl-3-methyl-5-hydroxy-6-metoxy-1,4-benzoquinol methylase